VRSVNRGGPGPGRTARALAPAAALLCLAGVLPSSDPLAAEERGWQEAFDAGALDPARWVRTLDGDFKEHVADVVDVSLHGAHDFRLRLRADTRGTRDDTVKFLGVRTRERFPIRDGTWIAVELDWNDQANGSYLSAGLILAAEPTEENPLKGRNWLKAEYVGVPPGRKARLAVVACVDGRERTLYTEGWPETNRTGRKIGALELSIVFRGSSFEVRENGDLLFEAADTPLGFDAAHVYLQLSSHSNYPPREVFFDDVRVGR
jgi:hypothetical protein